MTDPAHRTVLCFGDSNTHGTCPMASLDDIARLAPDRRWTGHMARVIGSGWTVIEEGHPGRTTLHDDPLEGAHKNGLRLLPALLESHRPIDLVVMMLGTNDLKTRFAVTPADIALSVEKLAQVILASNAGPRGAAPGLLLVCPPPVTEAGCLGAMFAGGAEKSLPVAGILAEIAARRGIAFLDAGVVAQVDPLDGVHLNALAHAKLGAAIGERVVALWP